MREALRVRRRLPLRFSLPLMVFSAFLLMAAITLILSHRTYQDDMIRFVELRAQIQSARLAGLATVHILEAPKEIRREIDMLMARGDITAVAITDPTHKVLQAHRSDWQGLGISDAEPRIGTMARISSLELHWNEDKRQLDILLPYRFPNAQETPELSNHGLIYIHADIGQQIDTSFHANFRNHLTAGHGSPAHRFRPSGYPGRYPILARAEHAGGRSQRNGGQPPREPGGVAYQGRAPAPAGRQSARQLRLSG
jgi:hypothetical protein